MDVTVIGGGVIGLMAAHALVHARHDVRVLARDLGEQTTSHRAAASFKPSSIPRGEPYRPLLLDSRRELDRWTRTGFADRLGITRIVHVEASEHPLEPRDYLEVMSEVRHLAAHEGDDIPGGYAYAVSYRTDLFDVPITLAALSDHLGRDHGVLIEREMVTSLDEVGARPGTEVVVNAAGLGARELANDVDVIPVRGQTARVPRLEATPGAFQGSINADGFYAYPRADGIVLGGTAEYGVWDDTPDPATIERIVDANARVLPGVREVSPIEIRAGLRPYRHSGVRLAVEHGGPVPIVHAYGHGGSGWTLGPGTAVWVARAVDELGPSRS
jgi:D-amino-acid oxidase